MNRALRFMLLGLAVVVVVFAVTWVTIPNNGGTSVNGQRLTGSPDVPLPASLFIGGLGSPKYGCLRYEPYADVGRVCVQRGDVRVGVDLTDSDLDALKVRVGIVYGAIVVVIILVALAFGAGRRSSAAQGGTLAE
jgi:hypothetical protein